MVFKLRRQWEAPWEVVESQSVAPVCTYCDDDGTPASLPQQSLADLQPIELDIVAVSADTSRTYVFDVKHLNQTALRNALLFSQKQLLHELAKRDLNILMLERYDNRSVFSDPFVDQAMSSWHLTIFRRGKSHRVEVQYFGKGVCVN